MENKKASFISSLVVLLSSLNFIQAQNVNWPSVAADPGCTRSSELNQINRSNVSQLEVAWTFNTGELDREKKKTIECTPLVIDGIMYITTGHLRVIALHADTGKPIWEFDPMDAGPLAGEIASGGVNRGLAFWSDEKANGERRLFHGTADGRLFSLIPETGKLDTDFGEDGVVYLRKGIDYDLSNLPYGPTSPGAIFEDLIILGCSNSEWYPPGAPGDVRAFNVRTGKEAWRFHTIPHDGEPGSETWPRGSGRQRSGANAWGGYSIDLERGIVFAGTGSAAADFYGGDRLGENLYANCVLALNARTGKRLWHFQTVHHDLWDHDLPIYPNLVTVKRNGQTLDAVAQVTKKGYLFLFDRVSGKPLFDIVETPVLPSTMPGEEAWPTQPIPVKPPPFSKQRFEISDVTDVSPEARSYVLKEFAKVRGGPANNPPSLEGTIVVPGLHGGATWSGASFDPETGYLFVNANNDPWLATLKRRKPYTKEKPYSMYVRRFTDEQGHPAIKPPWGTLTAINLSTGTFAWQIPFGNYPDLMEKGISGTGSESFGGTIVTAGGLVFIGGTKDELFHAYDKFTGELLWSDKLPAGGYATPCTYSVNGKQYICIAAGGAGKQQTKPGDAFVAYALPSKP